MRFLVVFGIVACFASDVFSATTVDPEATPEARALLNYIYSIYGKQMLTCQIHAPWGIDEIAYVYSVTGKYPAIQGIDFINEGENPGEVARAISYWKAGGLITAMWHEGAPTVGEGYGASLGTQPNFGNLFVPGTAENNAMLSDWDRICGYLKKLQDAQVPVIWRPFHECSGGWFWWDKSGGASFVKLWKYMFDYFTKTKGIHNCLWFLGYCGTPKSAFNPGEGYFDMVGSDTYGGGGPYCGQYNSVKAIHGSTIPIALHECGVAPDPAQNLASGCMFAWFMVWHTSYIQGMNTSLLKKIYTEAEAVTRDELPTNWSAYSNTIPVSYRTITTTADVKVRVISDGVSVSASGRGVDKITVLTIDGKVVGSTLAAGGNGGWYEVPMPRFSTGVRIIRVQGTGWMMEKAVLFQK